LSLLDNVLYNSAMLKWSSTNPAETGYYWVRSLRKSVRPPEESFYPEPQIVEVVSIVGELEVEYTGNGIADMLSSLTAEWYGPLDPPNY